MEARTVSLSFWVVQEYRHLIVGQANDQIKGEIQTRQRSTVSILGIRGSVATLVLLGIPCWFLETDYQLVAPLELTM